LASEEIMPTIYAINFDTLVVRAFAGSNLANSVATELEDTVANAANLLTTGATTEQMGKLYNKLAPAANLKPVPKFDTRELTAQKLMEALSNLTGKGTMPIRRDGATQVERKAVVANGGTFDSGPGLVPAAAPNAKGRLPNGERRGGTPPTKPASMKTGNATAAVGLQKPVIEAKLKSEQAGGDIVWRASALANWKIFPSEESKVANRRREGSGGWLCMELVRKNPGLTVKEYLSDKDAMLGHLKWDVLHGFAILEKA
jgi:hypothetical protein